MHLRTSSLRTRLALLFVVGAAVVLLVAALVLYRVLDGELRSAIDDGLQARGRDLEEVMREDKGEITDTDPFAQVLGPDGRMIDTSRAANGTLPVMTLADAPVVGRSVLFDREVPALGGPARILARGVAVNGQRYVLLVAEPLHGYEQTQQGLALTLLIGGPLLIALLGVGGWLLAGAALRPVQRMSEEADAISLTELGRRLPVPDSEDELHSLALTLNRMLDRIEEAISHERRFIDDASHELRSPITILRGELELALTDPGDPDEVRAALQSALDEADRLSRLASDLLVLARARAGELALRLEPVDVAAEASRLAGQLRSSAGIATAVEGTGVLALADRDRLVQVLHNLIGNAHRYARQRVLVRVDGDAERGEVHVLVADDGPGFPASMLPVTFERFARPDRARGRETGGTGLGLSIVAEIARAHGGQATAGNGPPLGGAWVQVAVPAAGAAASAGAAARAPGEPPAEPSAVVPGRRGGGGRESNPPDGDHPSHPL